MSDLPPVVYSYNCQHPTPCAQEKTCIVSKGDVVRAITYLNGERKAYCGRHFRALGPAELAGHRQGMAANDEWPIGEVVG